MSIASTVNSVVSSPWRTIALFYAGMVGATFGLVTGATDFAYAVNGRTAVGTIVRPHETQDGTTSYRFAVNGTTYTAETTGWPIDDEISVEYLGWYPNASRLAGEVAWGSQGAVVLFLSLPVLLIAFQLALQDSGESGITSIFFETEDDEVEAEGTEDGESSTRGFFGRLAELIAPEDEEAGPDDSR